MLKAADYPEAITRKPIKRQFGFLEKCDLSIYPMAFFLFSPFLANWMWFKKSFHKNIFFFKLLKQTNKPDLRHVFRCQNNCPCHCTYSFPETLLGFQNFLCLTAGLHLQHIQERL